MAAIHGLSRGPGLAATDVARPAHHGGYARVPEILSDVSRGARGGFAHPSLLPLQAVVMAARRGRDPGRAGAAGHRGGGEGGWPQSLSSPGGGNGAFDRIGGVLKAGRRGGARDDETIDKRFVLS